MDEEEFFYKKLINPIRYLLSNGVNLQKIICPINHLTKITIYPIISTSKLEQCKNREQ